MKMAILLPAEAERDRQHGSAHRRREDVVIARFRVELGVAVALELHGKARADIQTALVLREGAQDRVGWNRGREEDAEERIERGDSGHGWRGEFHGAAII